ncbi:hypothetical protein FRC00_003190, partial [Tulasnella sp. 408]
TASRPSTHSSRLFRTLMTYTAPSTTHTNNPIMRPSFNDLTNKKKAMLLHYPAYWTTRNSNNSTPKMRHRQNH